ncbi:MAG TPA: S1/P1 nuclease [Acidobacteriaceae bacterium]|nr:S1/P1 nuclease [Acidobacteriaceae bacterium]
MKKSMIRSAVTLALVFGIATPPTWGWGREGHRLTALVAENYLTPETRAAVQELLGKQSIADVASWADDNRAQHPETGKWHFADTPLADDTYNRDRDCPKSADATSPWRDCVVDRILYFEMRLADKTLTHDQRAEALKYIIHFIGDIHQPFHVLGDARGGNDNAVTFMGSTQCGNYKCNLHGTWDDAMIDHHDLNEKKYTAFLLDDIQQHDWQKLAGGNPVQWANASHKYAMNAYAPNGALITKEYYTEEIKVIDSQLALGGLRLARVLNTILGGQPVPPMPDAAPAPIAKP